MPHCLSTSICLPFVGGFRRGEPDSESRPSRSHTPPPIHILDDDSLLKIFYHCRPVLSDEGTHDNRPFLREWVCERWWYKLTHVCREWRYLILASASHLGLCLVCTYGTPVAVMLAHSPPLPLIIDYLERTPRITAEDEKGIMLALQHRDRVRRIRLQMTISKLRMVLMAINANFPILEYLYIMPSTRPSSILILSKTFQAPHLRHLILMNPIISMRSRLLTSTTGLVTLSLERVDPDDLCPIDVLQRLSLMPQLEVFGISFHSTVRDSEVERQLLDAPIMTHVTLPNLHWFGFKGSGAYLEALIPWMIAPSLESFQITFFDQLTFSVPHLLEFMATTEDLSFFNVEFWFSPRRLRLQAYSHEGAKNFFLSVGYAFILAKDSRPHTVAWIFRSFNNVKAVRVDNDLVAQVAHSLHPDDEEEPMELLPELKELRYSAREDADEAFTSFIDARQRAGHPVTLTRLRTPLVLSHEPR
ncbi:hypothetical protein BJV74DRAFT_989298 [Russula compacta]|nr:hypothetical protein BJV74DRAFT_989298 [Russula compacta]